MVNGYMTVKEAATKLGISERTVQVHCKNGRIPGVARVGRSWIIPEKTAKPTYVFICRNENDAINPHDNKN